MRTHRLIASLAAAAACTAVLGPAQPSIAAPAAAASPTASAAGHAGPHGCVPEGETGLYLSKEGVAKLTYSAQFLAALEEAGVTTRAVAPHEVTDGGKAVRIPIGEEYDNIELPSGRVCYPGGMAWRSSATGASYEVDDFWIKFAAVGDSKVLTTPEVNGSPRSGGELNLANFTVAQAFTTGQFVPHNGGIGPKRVALTIDAEFAADLNTTLGTAIEPGTPWATLDIAWTGIPSRSLPKLGTPELAGLKLIADAIGAPYNKPASPFTPPDMPWLPFGG